MLHSNTIGIEKQQVFYYPSSVPPTGASAYSLEMSWDDWNKRLKAHMKDAGVTQDQVAEHFDMTQGAVAHWLSKRNEINLKDFMQLCSYVKADPRRILFGETEPAVVLSQLQTMLEENPALRDMVARPRAPDERVAAHLPPAPAFRRAKVAAPQRRKKGR